jgi:hypothetical protein
MQMTEHDYFQKPYAYYFAVKHGPIEAPDEPPDEASNESPDLMVTQTLSLPWAMPQHERHANIMVQVPVSDGCCGLYDYPYDNDLGMMRRLIIYHRQDAPAHQTLPTPDEIQKKFEIPQVLTSSWEKPSQNTLNEWRRNNNCMRIMDQQKFYFLMHAKDEGTTPLLTVAARLVASGDIYDDAWQCIDDARSTIYGSIAVRVLDTASEGLFQNVCRTLGNGFSPLKLKSAGMPAFRQNASLECLRAFDEPPTRSDIDRVLKGHRLTFKPEAVILH